MDNQIKEYDKTKPKESIKSVSFFKLLFQFADKEDIVLICFAIIGSLIAGTAMPFIALLLGSAINNFGSNMIILGQEALTQQIAQLSIIYILVGIGIFIGSFMMVFFWTSVGKRLINKINEEYLRVILKQEVAWYDSRNVFELPTKIQGQIKIIENGVY